MWAWVLSEIFHDNQLQWHHELLLNRAEDLLLLMYSESSSKYRMTLKSVANSRLVILPGGFTINAKIA